LKLGAVAPGLLERAYRFSMVRITAV